MGVAEGPRVPPFVRVAADRMAPNGSRARDALRVGKVASAESLGVLRRATVAWRNSRVALPVEPEYRAWFESNRATAGELVDQIRRWTATPPPIHVRFVVRAGGAPGPWAPGPLSQPPGALGTTLDSLRHQTVAGWTAVVTGAAAVAGGDGRVVAATGADAELSVLEPATFRDVRCRESPEAGDFVVLLDAGDRVEPDLVHHIVARAWDDPTIDLVHWDDDVLVHGRAAAPRFRPMWSPEMLLSANPLGRSFAVRRRRVEAAGGLDAGSTPAAIWDFLWRAGLSESVVARVPRVLAHLAQPRPAVDGAAAVTLIGSHLERTGRSGEARWEDGAVHVRWRAGAAPVHVTIVIPTRHNRPMLDLCLPSLARTRHPSFDVVIVDNGGRTDERDDWYRKRAADLGIDLGVRWWDEPFNYSAVNNAAAAGARGDVLVFLNDDTELVDPGWLEELCGWATQAEIGLAGALLTGLDGTIQHGGVVIGMRGFADHLFAGMKPGEDSLLGPTSWYRNVLSVTGACVAIRREVFERIGGFDERMTLCGSDVALGLECRRLGLRNVCTPATVVRHLESVTRGTIVPRADYFASWWRYQRWLRTGDPYFSPALSLGSCRPRLRAQGEPAPLDEVAHVLGRHLAVSRQRADEADSLQLARFCQADRGLRQRVEASHERWQGRLDVRTVNWFIPDIDNPYYGGINTALRIADHLARGHGVENRFIVVSTPNELHFRSAMAAAFPSLADAYIGFVEGSIAQAQAYTPPADVSIATFWLTAFSVAHLASSRRRFYLIQDFEPMFYPAGTNYALAEQSYRLGLYGLCNTQGLLDRYRRAYGGTGLSFTPAVDSTVFHAEGRRPTSDRGGPVRVFLYSRPGHWRNCWELASLALSRLKERFGSDVHIVTAGSWANPDEVGSGIEHLGLLDYADTGRLYRTCDVGVALTVSAHPSYLPLELMACGVPVVAFDNPAGDWILRDEVNCLRTPQTVDGLVEALSRLVREPGLRDQLSARGVADIAARHGGWDAALAHVYDGLCDPEGSG